MALTEEQDAHLTEVLDDLGSVRDDLYPKAKQFVEDQIARHETYGARMFLSPKQLNWLHDLQREFCQPRPANPLSGRRVGGAPPGERPEEGDDDPAREAGDNSDMDDDSIPF